MKIKTIEVIENQDVYNMFVDKYNNFSINGGIVVHNCDALRYFCNMRTAPSIKPLKAPLDLSEWYDDEEQEEFITEKIPKGYILGG